MHISPPVLFWAFFSSTFSYQCCWPHSFIAVLSQKFYSVLSQCPSLPVLLFIFLIVGTDPAHTKVIGSLELNWVGIESGLRKLGNTLALKSWNDTKRYSHKLIWSWEAGRKTYMVKNRLWMGKWGKSETVIKRKKKEK